MDPEDSLLRSDDVDESVWDSPAKAGGNIGETPKASTKNAKSSRPTYQEQQEREESLRRELKGVRQVNETIEGLIQSLNKAKDNMKVWTAIFWTDYNADYGYRLSTIPSALHLHYSIPGLEYCHKRNTISD
jgi:hypothetical protein